MIAYLDPKTPTAPTSSMGRSVEELKQTVSGTRLSTWLQCRLKFYFRYIVATPKPTSPALFVGSCIHAVLQTWNLARWRHQPFDLERGHQIFLQVWEEKCALVRWKDDEETQREQAWNLIQNYLEQTPIPKDEPPEAVEVTVEADLAEHGLPAVIGIIDLVRKGGRIVDFKTTSTTPDKAKAEHLHETQMSLYAVLYRDNTGHQESAIELHHLVKLKTPKIVVSVFDPMTEHQQTRLFHCIESYVEGLDREDFVPSPGLQCGYCEYFHECRAWR